MAHEGSTTPLRWWAGALAATALLAAGCGSGHGTDRASAAPSHEHAPAHGSGHPAAPKTSAPGGEGTVDGATGGAATGAGGTGSGGTAPLGPAPRTREEALAFARKVVAKPAAWGGGFVRDSNFKSGPDKASELDKECVWRQRALRSSEVVSITRRSVLPAKGDKGALHVSAVVTVYRDEMSAAWDMAGTLEEVLRCPDQRLNATERVTGLASSGASPALEGGPDRDFVLETGQVGDGGRGGSRFYYWGRARFGAVIVSVAGKGADGRGTEKVNTVTAAGQAYMWHRVEQELGVAR